MSWRSSVSIKLGAHRSIWRTYAKVGVFVGAGGGDLVTVKKQADAAVQKSEVRPVADPILIVHSTELKVRADGFEWEVPAGAGAKMHFSAFVKNGTWTEVGDYVGAACEKKRTFQMTVKRRGPSTWPAGTLVSRD